MSGALLDAWPYARWLGMRLEPGEAGPIAVLPFAQRLIGNPILPALHGGAVASFLELAALARLDAEGHRARTIDFTVDYLRSARPPDHVRRSAHCPAGPPRGQPDG